MAARSSVESRLRQRDESRKAALEEKKAKREAGQRKEETSDYFVQEFARQKAAIVDLIKAASTLPKDQLMPHFDSISTEVQALQKFVSDSTPFLTAYDLQSSQQQMSQLLYEVYELQPKKKFAFKSRKKDNPSPTVTVQNLETKLEEQKSTQPSVADVVDKMVGFRNRNSEKLQMNAEELRGQDVNLSGLNSCEVRLCGPPSTLHMSKMNDCTILCGPVSSSAFVEDCRSCVFVVACQQLRVHTTTRSQFYLHITSRAIIEDCHQVTFAPYSWTYPEMEDHFKTAGLNKEVNNWDKVDDFNWLASKDPSPNWTVLPLNERTSFPQL